MKAHLLFTNIFAAIGVMGLICACQTTTTATGSSAPAQKETMLTQAGFKSYTVTTAQQKQHLSKLPAGKVSAVKHKGKKYYVYPAGTGDRVLVGTEAQYNAAMARAQMSGPVFAEETHGPHPVLIQEFSGFGPLGE
jgi:hypothetical protein